MSGFMKNNLLKTACLLVCIALTALNAHAGAHIQIRNFPRSSYSGGPQNWAVAQDSVGRLYVGNRDGMIMFDGERWAKYPLPNLTTVRSLQYDANSNRIYASGSEEFGYFSPAPESGLISYTSLTPTLPDDIPASLTEIWNIMFQGRNIWFQCDNHMLRYDGRTTEVLPTPGRVSCSSIIADRIYIGTENGHIYRIDGLHFAAVPSIEILEGTKIRGILPYSDGLLIATEVNGLFLLRNNTIAPFKSDINDFLKENQLFCSSSSGDDYIFGTVTHGAVVKNFHSGATYFINKQSGMQNNTVLNASFDRSGNIWLCLDNGLDYAVYNSPITNIIGPQNDVGAGYSSLLCGNRLYLGTNQGLFSTAYPFTSSPEPIALRKELQGQIWSITPDSGNTFFVAGDTGSYFSSPGGGGYRKIEGISGTHRIRKVKGHDDTAIASCYDGIYLLKRRGDTWVNNGFVEGQPQVRGDFEIDSSNHIWISHWLKGVYRLKFNPDSKKIESSRLYTSDDGLPTSQNNSVTVYHGSPVVVSLTGFYVLDLKSDRFIPQTELTESFSNAEPLSLHCSGDTLLLIDTNGFQMLHCGLSGSTDKRCVISRALSEELVNGFEHVNFLSPGEIIVANQNGFWSVNTSKDLSTGWHPRPVISAIYANGDSLVYQTMPSAESPHPATLPFSLNSLRFEFACPDFSTEAGVRYSSYLEGYDSGWSPMLTESSREYTRLPEGTYKLHLRARNLQNGLEDETVFSITILPPWYRSLAAKIAYLIFTIIFMILCAKMLVKWKSNAEARLEKRKEQEMEEMRQQAEQDALQKDYEIATLKSEKLEVDIRHKSDELSNATMNLIRKNEILNDIASKIAKIQSLSSLEQSVQKQLAHIQASIEQNISHDDDWSTFKRNFDIVYGDYIKRLLERHPQLSQSDIRLCCYIRMGLTSKDIAPLVNISFKSVEMARYRLRKKMELQSNVALTEYISSL